MIRIAALPCLCLALLAVPARAELPPFRATYSADGWATIDGKRVTGRVVQDGADARIDARYAPHKGTAIVSLGSRQAIFFGSVLPGMALKINYGSLGAIPDIDRLSWLNPRKVGRDDIDGEPADRYALEGTAPDRSRVTGTLWVTPDGIPVAGVFNSAGRHPHAVQFRLTDIARTADRAAFSPGALKVKTVTMEGLQTFIAAAQLAMQ